MVKHDMRNKKSVAKLKDRKVLHRENKRLRLQVIVLAIICVIILVLMILFAVRAYNHYNELKNHREYFRQPNAPIQDWMTIRSVVRYYNLTERQIYSELNVSPGTLVNELGIENSTAIDRLTIKAICVQKKLDCNIVVDKLNSIQAR